MARRDRTEEQHYLWWEKIESKKKNIVISI